MRHSPRAPVCSRRPFVLHRRPRLSASRKGVWIYTICMGAGALRRPVGEMGDLPRQYHLAYSPGLGSDMSASFRANAIAHTYADACRALAPVSAISRRIILHF